MKDPAFLMYSNDMYAGTRTMTPEERACYLDLLFYQHQNGIIRHEDLDRVLMFCSGVSKATLEATLEAKFIDTPAGFYNARLKQVIEDRQIYKDQQSKNGSIGQFWKKLKTKVSKSQYNKYRELVENQEKKDLLYQLIIQYKSDPLRVVEALLQHLENVIEIENENSKGKVGVKGKEREREIEKEEFEPGVWLTPPEVEKLKMEHGDHVIDAALRKLSDYKLSTGKKYKSDAAAIRSWVIDEIKSKRNASNRKNRLPENGQVIDQAGIDEALRLVRLKRGTAHSNV